MPIRSWSISTFQCAVVALVSAAAAAGPEGWRYGQFQDDLPGTLFTVVHPADAANASRLVAPMRALFRGNDRPNELVSWDGTAWTPFATDLPDPGFEISACTYFNGDLWIVGVPPGDNMARVLRAGGGAWHDQGLGLFSPAGVLPGQFKAAGGRLFMGGGMFTSFGFTRLAMLQNGLWQPAGLDMAAPPDVMTVLSDDLWVGGQITSTGGGQSTTLACWHGGVWNRVAGGPPVAVTTVAEYAGGIVAGGYVNAQLGRVFTWNGTSWSQLGADLSASVLSLAVFQGDLLALKTSAGQSLYSIMRWTGTQWEPWAPLTSIDYVQGGMPNRLLVNNDELILSGSHQGLLRAPGASSLYWSVGATYKVGRGWRTMNESLATGYYRTLVSDGERLFMCLNGEAYLNPPVNYAGNLVLEPGAPAWTPARGLFAGQFVYDALREGSETLIAGGPRDSFYDPGADPRGPVAAVRWNGVRSVSMSTGLFGSGNNTPGGSLRALTAGMTRMVRMKGRLFGATELPGFMPIRVVEWDGVQWAPVGRQPNAAVRALTQWRGKLVVAGDFDSIGGAMPASHIALFDGAKWEALGPGVNGNVYAAATFNDELYVAGTLGVAGGAPAPGVARWDGTTWHAVGNLTADNGQAVSVKLLCTYAGELFAAGNFTASGSTSLGYVARWNGETWREVGGTGGAGANARPFAVPTALAIHDNELYIGGPIGYAGGRWTGPYARWYQPQRPTITLQPVAASTVSGGTVHLSVATEGGTNFEWRRGDGTPTGWTVLTNGPTQGGTAVSGADSASLTLTGVSAADGLWYQCRVANEDYSVYSSPVRVTVNP